MGAFKWLFNPVALTEMRKTVLKAGKKKIVAYEQEIQLQPANRPRKHKTIEVTYDRPLLPAAKFITVAEATKMSGLSDRVIRYLCRNKIVEGYKGTFRWMVSVPSLESYLDSLEESQER